MECMQKYPTQLVRVNSWWWYTKNYAAKQPNHKIHQNDAVASWCKNKFWSAPPLNPFRPSKSGQKRGLQGGLATGEDSMHGTMNHCRSGWLFKCPPSAVQKVRQMYLGIVCDNRPSWTIY